MSEITVYENQINPITQKATELEIVNPAQMAEGVELLSHLNRSLDKITTEKERVTKPLNEALKAERSRWKPLETVLEGAIAAVRTKMTAYQTHAALEAEKEAKRIADRVARGTMKVETGLAKLDALERADDVINTGVGTVKFRTSKILKILDESLIPDEYWLMNYNKLLTDLKAGKVIPGATTEEIQTPVNYR